VLIRAGRDRGKGVQDPNAILTQLSRGADASTAISAPEAKPLSWRGLRDLAARAIDALNAMGIGRGDRVAILLRNGPEAGTAFACMATGGATARPKLVPLTQSNLTASARNIAGTLALSPADICLQIMPLFHIHGLVAGILSSLSAGAQVCITPGFNALRFFHWLEEVHPT